MIQRNKVLRYISYIIIEKMYKIFVYELNGNFQVKINEHAITPY